jgi:hypothetical protein
MRMKNLFLILLFCIGAPVCAMQKSEQDLKSLVATYIQECLLRNDYTSEDDAKRLLDAKSIELCPLLPFTIVDGIETDVEGAVSLLLLQGGTKRGFARIEKANNPIVPLICQNPRCGRVFSARGAFSNHVRQCRFAPAEQRSKYKVHACTTCDFGTSSAREFKKHVGKCKRFKKKLELLA